ncbi:Gmad2 immunoglobulin-like domain-containing protein [Nocardioides sp.]|uniref:Gmad2 immunoglobulin-like domain-containing protein n=1 Tax=Nocardioides sp. TaxID=35761 RepID=UPI002618D9FE|nr:Gmad2 immunoglobulin-like domain-containing protein [Nocardioides sp.]
MRNSTPRRQQALDATQVTRAAMAAVAGVAALSLLAGCGSDSSTAADPVSSESTSASVTPTPTPTQAPSTTAPTAPTTPAGSASTPVTALDLITLTAPTDGQAVSGSFDVHGTANSPEANVPWTIKNSAGKVVDQGAFTADGWMDKLYPYNGTVDIKTLAPGTYSFTVAVDEESDGESSKAPQAITVTLAVS